MKSQSSAVTDTANLALFWAMRAQMWQQEKASALRQVRTYNVELRRLHRSRRLALDRPGQVYLTKRIAEVKRALDMVHSDVDTARKVAFKLNRLSEELRSL